MVDKCTSLVYTTSSIVSIALAACRAGYHWLITCAEKLTQKPGINQERGNSCGYGCKVQCAECSVQQGTDYPCPTPSVTRSVTVTSLRVGRWWRGGGLSSIVLPNDLHVLALSDKLPTSCGSFETRFVITRNSSGCQHDVRLKTELQYLLKA